jgi:DNA polymerase-3 subunit gamma/tau
MSYIVLARKYRSNTFDEVVGQDHVAQTLKRAIESGRIAHAYLFCGTRGVGKTSMARIMAKALNCEKSDKPTTQPCGKCNSCLAIARGEDIDVIEIDAASNTGVDNVRDLIANAQFRPARARFKVYIIDEVHMLSKAAFNALLKTMEEPPEHVKFILATTEVEKVLPTILSRCQRYDFRNIPTREIAAHLKEICKSEKIKADDDALLLVAKAGAGSMRDSLSLLDRLLSVGEKQITIELIEQTLGMPRTQVIFDLAQFIGEGDVKKALEGADKLITGGLSADILVTSLSDHFRNLLILRTCGPKSDLVEVPGIALDDLAKQAARFEPVILSQDISILEELRRTLRSSQAGRAILDAALVRLALAEQFASVEELLGRVGAGASSASPVQKKKPESVTTTPAPSPLAREGESYRPPRGQRAPIAPEALSPHPSPLPQGERQPDDDDLPRPGKVWDNSGPSLVELLKQQPARAESNIEAVDSNDLAGVWNRLLKALETKGPSVVGLLGSAKFLGVQDGHAVLQYPQDQETVVRLLERNGKKETIRDVLSGLLSQNIGLKFEFDTAVAEPPPVAKAPAPPRPQLQRTAVRYTPPPEPVTRVTPEQKEQLGKDELIRAVIDTLGGEIVKVE